MVATSRNYIQHHDNDDSDDDYDDEDDVMVVMAMMMIGWPTKLAHNVTLQSQFSSFLQYFQDGIDQDINGMINFPACVWLALLAAMQPIIRQQSSQQHCYKQNFDIALPATWSMIMMKMKHN